MGKAPISKPSTYLLNCGRDEDRIWLLEQIRIEAEKNGISTAEFIWTCISKGYEYSWEERAVTSSINDGGMSSEGREKGVRLWTEYEIRKAAELYFKLLKNQNEKMPFKPSVQIDFLSTIYLTKRTPSAIEFKFMNISAILKEEGLTFLINFKPLYHYQKLLREIVIESFIPNSKIQVESKINKSHSLESKPISNKSIKKYYAVVRGRKIGIFTSWEETQKQIMGFPGNIFKGFNYRQGASEYLSDNIITIIQDLRKENGELTINEVVTFTGLSIHRIKSKNTALNLGLEKGYSKEYTEKLSLWKERRKQIREYIIANPNSTVKEVVQKTKANNATVIDEARKNGIENLLILGEQGGAGNKKMREGIELKEDKIRTFILENPGTPATFVSKGTGTSTSRIYALARKENLPLGKVQNQSPQTGKINKEKIRKCFAESPNATVKEIAHKTGLNELTVTNHAKKLGLIPHRKKSKRNRRILSPRYSRLVRD